MAGRKTTFSVAEDPEDKPKKDKYKMNRMQSESSFLGVVFDPDDRPDFHDPQNRRCFAAVVFSVITAQLVIVIACTAPFLTMPEAKNLVLENPWLIFVFLVLFVVPYFMLVCCESTRREFPTNIILLLFLTVGGAGTSACCTAWFETIVIIYTLVLTILVTIVIVILALAIPDKFTTWKCLLIVMMVFLTIYVIAAAVIPFFTPHPFKRFIYSSVAIALFSAFLLHDVKSIMGGHRNIHITPKTYLMGITQVFADVIGLFITFLEVVGSITEND